MIALDRLGVQFRRGKRILQKEGFLSFFKQVPLFLARSLFTYDTWYIYEHTLNGVEEAAFTPRVNDWTLKIISTQEELGRLFVDGYDFSPYPNIAEDRDRLISGAVLFCVFIGKELAHRSWVAMRERASEGVYPFPLDYRCEGAIGGTRTTPKYEGMGINTYVISAIYQYLKGRGVSKAKVTTRKNNIAYQKAHAKLGSRVCGEGYHLRLLSLWEFWRLKS